jgi:hypothetical protein
MISNVAWLTVTAIALAAATLGVLGLLAHIDEGRGGRDLAFDVLWTVSALVVANVSWRRTKWARHKR